LNDLSSGNPIAETTVTVKGDEDFSATQPLREYDVYLLALAPEQQWSANFAISPPVVFKNLGIYT